MTQTLYENRHQSVLFSNQESSGFRRLGLLCFRQVFAGTMRKLRLIFEREILGKVNQRIQMKCFRSRLKMAKKNQV